MRTMATDDVEVQRNDFLLEKISLVILSNLKLSCHTHDDILRSVYIYIILQITFNIITLNKKLFSCVYHIYIRA
jgi:hypothetical protein